MPDNPYQVRHKALDRLGVAGSSGGLLAPWCS
jgi:hypothetical protein